MRGGIAPGDGHNAVLAQTPIDSDLSYRLSRPARHFGERAIRIAIEDTLKVAGQRAVRDDGDSICLAIFQQVGLYGAVHHVVANLIRDDPVFAGGIPGSLKLRDRKIADADEAHLAGVHELLHGGEGLLDRHFVIWHMKLIEIDPLNP